MPLWAFVIESNYHSLVKKVGVSMLAVWEFCLLTATEGAIRQNPQLKLTNVKFNEKNNTEKSSRVTFDAEISNILLHFDKS